MSRQGPGARPGVSGKVIELDPEHLGARYNMAVAYHKLEDYKRSVKHLEVLISF